MTDRSVRIKKDPERAAGVKQIPCEGVSAWIDGTTANAVCDAVGIPLFLKNPRSAPK